jgi:3-deoxy-D-manno-octulosonic-acid transferase
VILIDAMGLLNTCYQIAEIAIVAGSFLSSIGGHNIFEPIIYRTPVIFGPYMHGQPDFLELILKAHAGKQVTLQELPATVLEWLQHADVCEQYISAGTALVKEVQGSVQRTFDRILPYLKNT